MMEKLNCDNGFKERGSLLFTVVVTVMMISFADMRVQATSNYYDHQDESEEPVFLNTLSSEDYTVPSLTEDSRFGTAEPSWELNLNKKEEPSQSMKYSKKKRNLRNCSLPSVATRGLIGSTIKRSEFATSRSELVSKLLDQDQSRKKREIKRNGLSDEFWTCETVKDWLDMGEDYYPRYVQTASCKSRRCGNGLFQCHPRTYKVKILKRVVSSDSTACPENDDMLPLALRSAWRLITVTVTHCCDCSGRRPGSV